MKKKTPKNMIEKFREFWTDLDSHEQENLWNIMTALRGPDDLPYTIKQFVTMRIRHEFFGPDEKTANKLATFEGYKEEAFRKSEIDWLLKRQSDKMFPSQKIKKLGHAETHMRMGYHALKDYPGINLDDVKKTLTELGIL